MKFIRNNAWLICFFLFLLLFAWKVILKGYLIGPFDFLMGFYHPYKDIDWKNSLLNANALQYKNFLMSDVVTVVLPVKLLAIDMLKKFQIPLWNPYLLNGTPLLANIQSAVFYPLNIFYFIFKAPTAFNIYILSQPVLGFVFMFLFLRSVKLPSYSSYLGAISFAFSAFSIVWLPWGTVGHAMLWLPLILYSISNYLLHHKKKYLILLLCGLVFSFFAGHTQTTVMVIIMTFIYLLFQHKQLTERRNFITLGIVFVLFFLIVSIQLIPTAEMYRQSVRELVATESFYTDQTLYFSSYLSAFAPDFFGNPVTRNWWGKMNYAESAIYFGTIALFLSMYALIHKKENKSSKIFWFAFTTTVTGIVLSTQNPVSYLIYKINIPLISSSTFSRYSSLFIFGGSILAALGFQQLTEDLKQRHYKTIYIVVLFIALSISVLWLLIFLGLLPRDYLNNLSIIKRNMLLPTILIGGFSVFLLALSTIQQYNSVIINKYVPIVLSVVILFLSSFELLRFANKYTPFTPKEFFYPQHELLTKLENITLHDRYYGYFPSNVNSIYKVRGIQGSEPLYNLNLGELASQGKKGVPDVTDRASLQFPEGPYKYRILDLFSTKYIVDKTDSFRNWWIDYYGNLYDDRFKEVWKDKDTRYKIYINRYAVERQKMFYKIEIIKNKDKLLKRLISPDFNPQEIIILESKVKSRLSGTGSSTIHIVKDTPTKQSYRISTTQPGIFSVTDTYYPGWEVRVDNKQEKMLKTNYAFRGVEIDKGTHKVVFEYKPMSFYLGVILTIIGIVLSIIFFK